MMLITCIGSIKVIIMLTVPESKHRNNGSTRSRRESGHTNRHRSRKRRLILTRLRISYRGTSIRGLITDRRTSISRLITDRRASICGLITDRCHNGGNDRRHDSLRHEHFNLIVVVSVVVMVIVVVMSMVVIVVSMVVIVVIMVSVVIMVIMVAIMVAIVVAIVVSIVTLNTAASCARFFCTVRLKQHQSNKDQ